MRPGPRRARLPAAAVPDALGAASSGAAWPYRLGPMAEVLMYAWTWTRASATRSRKAALYPLRRSSLSRGFPARSASLALTARSMTAV